MKLQHDGSHACKQAADEESAVCLWEFPRNSRYLRRKGGGVLPKKKIYMAVTRDALSLPLAVADSAKELAELRGAKRESILSAISRWKKGAIKCPGYIMVEIEEDVPQKKASRRSKQTGEFDREIFQKRIRQLRQESGMTKTAFAAFTGIAYITLFNYERGEVSPGVDMLFRIAARTGCSVDWLIGLKEEQEEE